LVIKKLPSKNLQKTHPEKIFLIFKYYNFSKQKVKRKNQVEKK